MGDLVMHALAKGISMSIAVTSTTIAERKQAHKLKAQQASDPKTLVSDTKALEINDSPPAYSEHPDVDVEWALDEAGDYSDDAEAKSPSLEHQSEEAMADHLLSAHLGRVDAQITIKPLPALVLLPQRRPSARGRGFVRAYAPCLGECSGIDQETFLQFLDDFDMSTRASPIFNVINMACFGLTFAGHIGVAVASAVQVVNGIAKDMNQKYKTNKFLNEVNEKLFKPRGLYVLIMSYKPKQSDEPLLQVDRTDHISKAAAKCDSAESSVLKKKLMMLRSESGTTKHDEDIPACAPLVYPSLDRSLDSTGNNANQLKLTKVTMDEYLDRRAQVKCVADHKNSAIAKALPPSSGQQVKFANRFCDPDHPVNSGSIFGVVTGGTFDPIAMGRVRRAKHAAEKKGEPPLTKEEEHTVYMGRGIRGRKGAHEKTRYTVANNFMQRDLLYLCVVNLPKTDKAC